MKIIRFVLKTLKEAHSVEAHLGVAILLAGVLVASSVDAKPISPASAKAVTEGGSPQPNTRCQAHAKAGEVFAVRLNEITTYEKSGGRETSYLKLVRLTSEQVPYPGGGFDLRYIFTFQRGIVDRASCLPMNPTEVTFNGGSIQIPGLVYMGNDWTHDNSGPTSFYFVYPVNGN